MKIKVLIADDHTIVRAGLTALLGTEKDIEVVGEAKNGAEAVSNAVELHPDIVIMDLMMPKMDGVAATKELIRKAPSAKTILLTTYGTSDGIAHALSAGASGAAGAFTSASCWVRMFSMFAISSVPYFWDSVSAAPGMFVWTWTLKTSSSSVMTRLSPMLPR